MKRRIVLLGPPASGKGTQAELMQARYQFPIASPGAILREERKLGTPLGIEADKSTAKGQLAPDDVVNSVVESWLGRHGDAFVFDGYPRSLGQASALDEILARRRAPLELVILLEADMATIRSRVESRVLCASCGRTFNVGLHLSTPTAPCPSCSGVLVRRTDDTPETLAVRMGEYSAKTEPLISRYSAQKLLHRIDACRAPESVFGSIAEILERA